MRQCLAPILQDASRLGTARVFEMPSDERLKQRDVMRFSDWIEIHAAPIAANPDEISRLIKDESDSTAHASAKIPPGPAQYHDCPVSHVFAAVIADPFDHRCRAGISNRKTFSRDAVQVSLAARRPIQYCISDEYVLLRLESRTPRRERDDFAA